MEKTEQQKAFLTQYFVSFHSLASHSVHYNQSKKKQKTRKQKY